ncbi:aryl-alcohol dehydrogenase-like predicted oxidoreductase [Rhodoblastus acidophilus]|uniref:aldo/keto reductase n=1 Tax=Rhodoblastus acidophilus TaxID=1074 RepID=UPI0022254E98|nr:aldo/keto reductase [Rhodoblastus acidophilus]MCW2283837.1 aryl-alcohol dehydrogenase-like predicted oxidoreductase [Rhodoblastus acidophilus]MCW2332533.1 aryl-alcohol dehydrogenase-like predicted oxidoreductase [Rhodoblastus acidophilus]
MIRTLPLPGCNLRLSRFVFGCARLFNAGADLARARLLAEAADAGFTHFDVAPSYGFGMAERDLAPLLKSRPGLTVTSKVGLYAPAGEDSPASAIFLRKAAGKLAPALSRAQVDFSLSRARESLSGSLRRLGRDHIDLFLLHAPRLDLLAADEWRSWLDSLRAQGRIGAYGVAVTSAESALAFLDHAPPLAEIIQHPDSLDLREADALVARGRAPQLTYGYVAAARQRQPRLGIAEILEQALRRNPEGALVVSTSKMARVQVFAQAAESEAVQCHAPAI